MVAAVDRLLANRYLKTVVQSVTSSRQPVNDIGEEVAKRLGQVAKQFDRDSSVEKTKTKIKRTFVNSQPTNPALKAIGDALPVSSVNKLPPDFRRFLIDLISIVPEKTTGTNRNLDELKSSVNSKYQAVTSYRESTGVDRADEYQAHALEQVRSTLSNLEGTDVEVVASSIGQSFFALKDKKSGRITAVVNEGLGTKNHAADAILKEFGTELGEDWYYKVAQDNVAMVVNDLLTSGILPKAFQVHVDAGAATDDDFFTPLKGHKFNDGTRDALNKADCVWAGGETAVLTGLVEKGKSVLSGSVVGIGDKVIEPKLETGDRVVLIGSSGIHSNGISLVRKLADELPDGYRTNIGNGQTLAEALLTPTHIYANLVKRLHEQDVNLHFISNITGHAWDNKISRAPVAADYILDGELPEPQQIFKFLQEKKGLTDEAMYQDYNMGAGFALYVPESEIAKIRSIGDELGLQVYDAGSVKLRNDGIKTVQFKSQGLENPGQQITFESKI